MISEGSCDTEDWSNDAENTALHHKKIHLKCTNKETVILKCDNISKVYGLYCRFGEHKRFLYQPQTFE